MIDLHIGVAEIKYFSMVYNDEPQVYGFFDNRISTTAINSDLPAWENKEDGYMFGDKVYFPSIHAVFSAKSDNTKSHPITDSRGWWFEGDNQHRSLDQQEKSESFHPDGKDAIEIFDTQGMTYLVGMNIKGASRLTIYRKTEDTEWSQLGTYNLLQETCFKGCCTCCDEGTFSKDRYIIKIDNDQCSVGAKIKVVLTKDAKIDRITIGLQAVVCERNLGCVSQADWKVDIPESYKTWDGKGYIAKDIFYIKRTLNTQVGVYETKAKDDFDYLMSVVKRKHFFWVTKTAKIGNDNLYDTSLVFGSFKSLGGSASEFDVNNVSYSVSGIES